MGNTLHDTHLDFGYKTRPIAFTLVVDDFAVKSVGKENAHHLRNALLHSYKITTDWGGKVYSGMMLIWYYQKGTCDMSMQGYVANVLNKFQHYTPRHHKHTPSKYVNPIYGENAQYATRDETPILYVKQGNNIQNIT
jgi:hypothetical protein